MSKEPFSLKDHLFNAESLGDLAAEFAVGVPGFDADGFLAEVLPGLEGRELKARIDWIADCLEPRLPEDFGAMAAALEAALPPPLDPGRSDDDFGRFIHAVHGVLAVRHGMEAPERALDLLEAATQRFSMEFYIRPFLTRHPDLTLARLQGWVRHPNYHVRRLVSEGTRPSLPWAGKLTLDPGVTLPLLDKLHADPTRYVTRSVANHLNDIAKKDPEAVLARLAAWKAEGRQAPGELAWMTRHALRTLVKSGHEGALAALGYDPDADLRAEVSVPDRAPIGGMLDFEVTLAAGAGARLPVPALVDFALIFYRPGGAEGRRVFKLKAVEVGAAPVTLTKRHRLKGDASTFTLYPGPHRLELMVNGRVVAEGGFELTAP